MKIDIYTKLILLSIAISLWGILLKPVFVSEDARASSAIQYKTGRRKTGI